MKTTLEKLWNEYISSECAMLDTAEERDLSKNIAAKHELLTKSLTEEQNADLEKFIDLIYDLNAIFIQKTFLKGCEFSACFLFESLDFGK